MKRKKLSLMDVGNEGILSRNEMKQIVAGSGNFKPYDCNNKNDYLLGQVCCSRDIDPLTCCQVQFPNTTSAYNSQSVACEV
ncbi:MAG TPA: hypothetical protein VK112_12110 [Fodinibius sp.]|nr:hypothetical protein [Fodinibius sp.]